MNNAKPMVLVTGGAGYIGSHVVLALVQCGIPCVVLDDLSTGNRPLVPANVPFVEGDVGDKEQVRAICREYGVTAVMHFAGRIVVPESVSQPLRYYEENVCHSRALIEAVVAEGVRDFVFSSSASVYGEPTTASVDETAPPAPMSPYGTTKLMVEWILRDTAAATDLRYAALRYFNVAGADPKGRSGQIVRKATHLIKVACEVACGARSRITVFGDDYGTPDGTCIRDFIHVSDLADAHLAALDYLGGGGESTVLNCGNGRGYSVREVLRAMEAVTGNPLPSDIGPRRPGDVETLIADPAKAQSLLGWSAKHTDLEFIVRTALDWERRQRGS